MLTSEVLPSQSVIATHLYKSAWAVFVELALGFSDIDDVRNGLLLWKPIEHAFDTAQMCFTYDSQNDRYDKHFCFSKCAILLSQVHSEVYSAHIGGLASTIYRMQSTCMQIRQH